MTDGMPNSIGGLGDFPPLIGVERVEVLKGSGAILGDSVGSGDFGGLINVVMKKPQSDPVHELSYSIGDHGDTQAGIDLAGPLGNNKELTYRPVFSGEYADRTAQGYDGQRSSYFAPSIGWGNATTKLIVGVERIVDRLPIPDHTILLVDQPAKLDPEQPNTQWRCGCDRGGLSIYRCVLHVAERHLHHVRSRAAIA